MHESLDSRKLELRARPTLNMMIPMNVFEGPTKDHHGRGFEGESGDETLDDEGGKSKEVRVKVLVKRGSKQQTKQMFIPRDCSLVQSTKQKEAAELEEKQDIKRLVLEYNDREEELNGLGTQPLGYEVGVVGGVLDHVIGIITILGVDYIIAEEGEVIQHTTKVKERIE